MKPFILNSFDCRFDPKKDLSPVEQFGSVDLRAAYANGTIPGDLVFDENQFNGVEDPDSLVGRSRDVFEAFRKVEKVHVALADAASKQKPASSSTANE